MKLEQRFQRALHVGVAGMHLVDHQHLACQTQQTQRLVFALQGTQQGLIHRAHAGRRQQGTFVVVGQPAHAAPGGRLVELPRIAFVHTGLDHRRRKDFHQSLASMGQREAGLPGKQLVVDLGNSPVHGVGRGHGGQGDEEAFGTATGDQAMRQHHGGFGLAGTRDILQQVDLRAEFQGDGRRPILQG